VEQIAFDLCGVEQQTDDAECAIPMQADAHLEQVSRRRRSHR
jgi:hypothetical protein